MYYIYIFNKLRFVIHISLQLDRTYSKQRMVIHFDTFHINTLDIKTLLYQGKKVFGKVSGSMIRISHIIYLLHAHISTDSTQDSKHAKCKFVKGSPYYNSIVRP